MAFKIGEWAVSPPNQIPFFLGREDELSSALEHMNNNPGADRHEMHSRQEIA